MQNVVADLAVESEAATALGDAAGRGRRRPRRPARGGAAPDRAAAGEVLGLQAHPDDGGRGAGVPGRQRLRRGVRDAAALPRVAAELDLGGLGQRQRPRRAARARPRAGGARGLDHRGRPAPAARTPGSTGRSRTCSPMLGDTDHARGVRPPAGRPDGRLPAGLAAGAVRPRRGRRRLLRHAAGHRLRRHARHAARPAPTCARSSSARRRGCRGPRRRPRWAKNSSIPWEFRPG